MVKSYFLDYYLFKTFSFDWDFCIHLISTKLHSNTDTQMEAPHCWFESSLFMFHRQSKSNWLIYEKKDWTFILFTYIRTVLIFVLKHQVHSIISTAVITFHCVDRKNAAKALENHNSLFVVYFFRVTAKDIYYLFSSR